MTPAFGFSVGDFVSAINLIRKISKALKETGGASAEYQDAVIELKGLKYALQHLEALESTQDNTSHVNAIRGMALACQLPLRDFMKKLERYESSLGPWTDRTSFRSAGRKTRWAVSFGQEVEKLRALVAAKLININLLLTTHSSQTVSSLNVRAKQDHGDLISKIAEQRAALHQVHGMVEHIEDRMEDVEATSQAKLDAISSKSDATHASVMSLRNLAEQVMAFVGTFPREIRDLLYTIMQADWRTYQAVLQIQERLAHSPSSLHDSNIQFTNALGEYRELPYEYFCHWEPFEGFLRAQFKDKPGENKILDGHFHIIDVRNQRAIVKKEHWSRSISQGATLTMSMIMSHLQGKPGHCPRRDCTGVGMTECEASSQLTCGKCYLKFFPTSNGLEDLFSRVIVSEEDVARQQVEEDLRLYGSRPKPPDAVDIDESTQLANLHPKRNASEFEAAVDRPAKVRKRGESKAFNYEAVTAMDWNSGASPLDAWLNQSAVPSTAAALEPPDPGDSVKDLVAQEVEEIKVFRNVHVAMAPSPKEDETAVDELEGLELGAQIYYRNIRDRYPLLPTYLARRLAQANYGRSERLRSERLKPKQPVRQVAVQPQSFFTDVPAWRNAAAGSTYQMMTLNTENGPIQVPVDVQAATKVADEKRKRNGTASHRFRQRRKEKALETAQKSQKLEHRINILREMKCIRKIENYFCITPGNTGAQARYDIGELPESSPPSSPPGSQGITRSLSATEESFAKFAGKPQKRNVSASHRFRQRRKDKERESAQKIKSLEKQIQKLEEDMKDYEWRQGPAVAATVAVAPFLVKGTTKLVDELTSRDFSKAGKTPTSPIPSSRIRSNSISFIATQSSQTISNNLIPAVGNVSNVATPNPSFSDLPCTTAPPAPISDLISSNTLTSIPQIPSRSPPPPNRPTQSSTPPLLASPAIYRPATPPPTRRMATPPPISYNAHPYSPFTLPRDRSDRVSTKCSDCTRFFWASDCDGKRLCNLCIRRKKNESYEYADLQDKTRGRQKLREEHTLVPDGHGSTTYREVDERSVTRSSTPKSSILQGTSPIQGRKPETYSPMHRSPSSDFWTGGSPRHSAASSMNSSLHGRPTFDPQEQNPTFLTNHRRNSSASLAMPPALPPPPVELGKVLTFDCDICGQKVQVERRHEWQKHVLNDLRPYLCTFPDCATADQSYASRSAFLDHEIMVHELEMGLEIVAHELESYASTVKPESEEIMQEDDIACLFCREILSKAKRDERARHVGRHMEEIAFSVVTKPYEDWEFYTDSSGMSNKDVDLNLTYRDTNFPYYAPFACFPPERTSGYGLHICEHINHFTGKPCNSVWARQYDLVRHEDSIHNNRKQKVRCHICPEEKTFARNDALNRHMRVVHPNHDWLGKTRKRN